jgi:hypothetical protein
MTEIEGIWLEYRSLVERARLAGFSTSNITGECIEHFVAESLNLDLIRSGSQKGYDAVDADGRRVQIKGRSLGKRGKIQPHFRNLDFDYAVVVFFGDSGEILHSFKIESGYIEATAPRNARGVRAFSVPSGWLDGSSPLPFGVEKVLIKC